MPFLMLMIAKIIHQSPIQNSKNFHLDLNINQLQNSKNQQKM
ncbi:hypothetical protein BLA29_015586 [Euroglyphus maynei]|uniref:Uncharacterized protein n=1 Tax=Euroglyphus maynei TaxID=6958 RepID=A0A1Y3B215_EURMA|nr:hypothetical protein BLA29_015586 [Euroglyphus maynei]